MRRYIVYYNKISKKINYCIIVDKLFSNCCITSKIPNFDYKIVRYTNKFKLQLNYR